MKRLLLSLLLVSSSAFADYPAFLYGGGSRNEQPVIVATINRSPGIEEWVLMLRPDSNAVGYAGLPLYFIQGFTQEGSCKSTGQTLVTELKAAKLMFIASCSRVK